jgi:F-type H+-transporting ATPase subunit b
MALSFVLASAAAETGAANPISFDLWTFIFQALNVLLVLGGLYVLLFKPLATIIAKREEYVENSLSQASSARAEAEKLLAEYQAQMRNAHKEAQEFVEKSARDVQTYERQRRAEADSEYEKMLAKATRDIETERQKALASIRDEVATLVVMAASKVLGRTINEADHRDLIQEFVTKVGETQ